MPEIKKRAKRKLAEALQDGIALQHAISVLKAERMKKGLSLADINERSGIQRSTLSRLENSSAANPTISTLSRYADAVGKKMLVVLDEAEE